MKKMLIIEDDKIVASIYRNRFQAEGFQVQLADDGESGLTAVKQFRPDMVILDLMLPKLNGVEVLKRIRADEATKALPVIVLSNAYLTDAVQDAWKAGANKCMVKASCTPRQLIEMVNRLRRETTMLPASPRQVATGAPAPTTPRPRSTPNADSDRAFQAELLQTFLDSGNEHISQLRALLQTFIKSESDTARLPLLFTLYRRVHSLTSNSAVAGLGNVARMASALEALIEELYEKPRNINASAVRTVAHTIDFLAALLKRSGAPDPEDFPEPNVLVVDDEDISRRAVIYALDKARLKCVNVSDPNVALTLLEEKSFDLIFLDVDMPVMNGFDLCTRLRALPAHAKTPVIFVTGLTDFESRARSTLSGGNDLIAKPFLFMELAVKALTHVLRGQLEITRA
jgi:DNA-binding response OmpR family regulator